MLHQSRRFFVVLALASMAACGGRTDDPGAWTGTTGGTGGSTGGSGGTTGGTGGSTGGSGGTTGGSGGTTGGTGGGQSDAGNCGCFAGHIEWGMNGGHVAFSDTSTLDPCITFSHRRVQNAPDPPGLSCTQNIPECTGVVPPGAITTALADPAVQTALAAGTIVYGEDTRPVDGQVFRFVMGRSTVDVGRTPCTLSSCKPVPPGVQNLVDLLQKMTKEQLSREPCRSSFP